MFARPHITLYYIFLFYNANFIIFSPLLYFFFFFFFFSSRRRHTRSDRDWSSDVCSSDLLTLARRPLRFETRLERLHQVDDLGLRRLGRLLGDLLALHLPLDLLEDSLAHVVLVLRRLERVRGRLLDELHGHLELGLLHFNLRDRDLRDAAHFVAVVQLLHHQAVRLWSHRHEVLLAARRILPNRCAVRLLERLRQQPVGALTALVRSEEIRLLDVHAGDLGRWHELSDLDGAGALWLFELLELFFGEDDVASVCKLVPLHRVVPFDDLAILAADVLLLQTSPVFPGEHVEGDSRSRLARAKPFNRH